MKPGLSINKNNKDKLLNKYKHGKIKRRKNKIKPKEKVDNLQIKAFKPVIQVKKPEDYSGNWKQLKDVIAKNDKKFHKTHKKLAQNFKENQQSTSSLINKKLFDALTTVPHTKKELLTRVTKAIALDCEMVGGGFRSEENILARVSVVNEFGSVLYDQYVTPTDSVSDYRTEVSGIRPEHLQNAEPFPKVQKDTFDLMVNRILVGHDLQHDMKCLLLSHPKSLIRDTSRYKPFIKMMKGRTPSLKKLTEKLLGVQIQAGEHDSVQDARAAMKLYMLNRKEWEEELRVSQSRFKRKRKKSEKDATFVIADPT